jgi:hypothetical protein
MLASEYPELNDNDDLARRPGSLLDCGRLQRPQGRRTNNCLMHFARGGMGEHIDKIDNGPP